MIPKIPRGMGPDFIRWFLLECAGPDGSTSWTTLRLSLPLQPKERPRAAANPRGGRPLVYTSPNYRKWLKEAEKQLSEQWTAPPLAGALAAFEFHGSARSDLDNLEGAVLDAAVKAGVFANDRVTVMPAHISIWQASPTPEIFLYVRPWWSQSR